MAYNLLLSTTYYCAWPVHWSQKGLVFAMAVIVLTHRASQILVDAESVSGCANIERLSRVPGSPKSVKGLILFKGKAVPLVSLFGERPDRLARERTPQSRKSDDYAIVLSVKGFSFAARVDGSPTMCADLSSLENTGRNTCYLRKKHLERLLEIHSSQETKCRRIAPGNYVRRDVVRNNSGRDPEIQNEVKSRIADPCCVIEE